MWSFSQPAQVLTAAASIVVGVAIAAAVMRVGDSAPTTSVRTTPSATAPTPSPHDLLCNPLRDRYSQALRTGGEDATAEMRDAGASMIQLGC